MSFYGCISVKPVGREGWSSRCSTANWWERSPNYNNANNFCNVNTNGTANNNNASNSNGLAPDFVSQKWFGSNTVAKANHDLYERRNTSRDISPKQTSDTFTRTPLRNQRAWRGMCLTSFHVYELSRLDGTLQDICTEVEFYYE